MTILLVWNLVHTASICLNTCFYSMYWLKDSIHCFLSKHRSLYSVPTFHVSAVVCKILLTLQKQYIIYLWDIKPKEIRLLQLTWSAFTFQLESLIGKSLILLKTFWKPDVKWKRASVWNVRKRMKVVPHRGWIWEGLTPILYSGSLCLS